MSWARHDRARCLNLFHWNAVPAQRLDLERMTR